MARYLIVAYQTAESTELRRELKAIATRDPEASFVLLVPATPVEHLGVWYEGEAQAAAQEAGEKAMERFRADGVEIEKMVVGDPNPVYAIKDAFIDDTFGHVVVSTLPIKASRWIKMDVVSQVKRALEVPVTHVETEEPAG